MVSKWKWKVVRQLNVQLNWGLPHKASNIMFHVFKNEHNQLGKHTLVSVCNIINEIMQVTYIHTHY